MTDPARPTTIRHRIIGVTMLMAFILYLDRICLAEIVKSASFNADVVLTKPEIGRLLGSFFFAYALFQVPAGLISDRFGARAMLTSTSSAVNFAVFRASFRRISRTSTTLRSLTSSAPRTAALFAENPAARAACVWLPPLLSMASTNRALRASACTRDVPAFFLVAINSDLCYR